MVILQLCRWKCSHKETLWQTLFDWNWILVKKTKKSLSEPPFRGLRVTYTLHSLESRGRPVIRHNWTFLAISYGWDVISQICRSRRFSKGVGHFERTFQTEGASLTNSCWCQKTRVIAFSCDDDDDDDDDDVLRERTHCRHTPSVF